MVKLFILFLVLISAYNSIGQRAPLTEIQILNGFDNDMPLEVDETITVVFPLYSEAHYLIQAYKGETKTLFIKRMMMKRDDNLSDNLKLSRDSLPIDKSKSNVVDQTKLPPWVIVSRISLVLFMVAMILSIFFILKKGPKNNGW